MIESVKNALLEHFGSIRACLTASAADLEHIKAIGGKTARRIVATVSEPRLSYGMPPAGDDLFLF